MTGFLERIRDAVQAAKDAPITQKPKAVERCAEAQQRLNVELVRELETLRRRLDQLEQHDRGE